MFLHLILLFITELKENEKVKGQTSRSLKGTDIDVLNKSIKFNH